MQVWLIFQFLQYSVQTLIQYLHPALTTCNLLLTLSKTPYKLRAGEALPFYFSKYHWNIWIPTMYQALSTGTGVYMRCWFNPLKLKVQETYWANVKGSQKYAEKSLQATNLNLILKYTGRLRPQLSLSSSSSSSNVPWEEILQWAEVAKPWTPAILMEYLEDGFSSNAVVDP